MKINYFFLLLLVITSVYFVPAAADVSLDILQPSEAETHFAELRDFYVYGYFENTGDPVDVRVRLYDSDGEIIRTLQSYVDMTGATPSEIVDMSLVNENQQWGGILAVEAITEPYGLANGANKVLVSKDWNYFLALVQGGVTKDITRMYYETDVNNTLVPYSRDFTAGTYTIVVDVVDKNGNMVMFTNGDGKLVNKLELNVTSGLTNSSLGVFRPSENKEQVITYAQENDLRAYVDWFPGYFQVPDGSAGYQIPALWQPNNGIEVVNQLNGTKIDKPESAENSVLMYNLGGSSASIQVELAQILGSGLEDSDRTTYLYYDTGEISYTWVDADSGETKTLAGNVQFYPDLSEQDSRVIYTHADKSGDEIAPNTVSLLPNLTKVVDTTPYEVTVTRGEYLALYGLTRPIETAVSNAGTPYRYTIDNQIMSFTYTCDDAEYEFAGLLTRVFVNDDGSLYAATGTNYEFGHVFTAEDTSAMPIGTYTYSVKGCDVNGNYVEKTDAKITITVLPAGGDEPAFALPLSILLALFTLGAAILMIRKL
jgi:hypothetical protein